MRGTESTWRGLHRRSLRNMFIESIDIASFAGLKGFKLTLDDGLNIIEGKNESGKSTVCDFIRFVFYGFSGKSDRENHLSFSNGAAEGSVTVNHGGKRYRIERKCLGAKDSVGIFDLADGSAAFEGRVPGEVFFGLPEKLFTSTVFVGQMSGKRIDGKETSEAVENLLFSADETVSVKKTLSQLDKARQGLLHKNKKGGRLYELDNEISELAVRLAKASGDSGRLISLRGDIDGLKQRIDKNEHDEQRYKKALDDYRLDEIRKRNKKVRELEKSFGKSVLERDVFKRENTHDGFFPDRKYLDSLRSCGEEIARSDRRVKEVEAMLAEHTEKMSAYLAEKNTENERIEREKAKINAKKSISISAAVICCLLFLVAAVGTVILFIGANSGLGTVAAIFAGLMFSGLVTGLVFTSRFASELNLLDVEGDGKEDELNLRLEFIRNDLTSAKEEKNKYKEMLDDLCGKWKITPNAKSLADLKDVIEGMETLDREVELRRVAYVSLKTDSEEKSRFEPEDDGHEIVFPEDFDPKEYKRRYDFLTGSSKVNIEMLHKKELDLTELSARTDLPSGLYEIITEKEFERDRLKEKYDAYILAYDSIEEASRKMRAAISPKLSETAGRLVSDVTDGKYTELGVDSALSLTFRPETEDGGRLTKGEEFMSAGTSDAAYVSLRIALAELICGEDKMPPMIFDESFTRLDDGRLGNMLKLLSMSGGQVLLFSSCERERERASETVGAKINLVSLT